MVYTMQELAELDVDAEFPDKTVPCVKCGRDTSKDTYYVWYDPERGYIFRDTEPAPEDEVKK
jgi:hypothetical protein